MRFDVVSVFPEFFGVLNLSLLGKAQDQGILEIHSHDLRDWTTDPHRTVDDTPAGGGAGMVMRPDVWGTAIDSILTSQGAQRAVLAIPTPSGVPLTQRMCEELAQAEHILIACGRYEGIDSRVADHYQERGVRVLEYSLGDYVLNGGEVAAVALVEAVGRLVPGMVGNPESLVEESHGAAGLLEYPIFTRPQEWRGCEIPDVLTSGNHGLAHRWRRDQALSRTCERRPDMIRRLDRSGLDKADRRALAVRGWLTPENETHPVPARIRIAEPGDAVVLAEFAARTFPDAAPDYVAKESVASFILENLAPENFRRYIADPQWLTLIATDSTEKIIGYTLSLIPVGDGVAAPEEGAPAGFSISGRERKGPLIEISKFYVDSRWRGSGLSVLLFEETRQELLRLVASWPEPYVWLGTNMRNKRAHKAYKNLGFVRAGKREFVVGEQNNSDVVFARPLNVE